MVFARAPLLTSQNLIVLSYDPEASSFPSSEKATAGTEPLGSSMVFARAPVITSQILTVLSADPVASSCPLVGRPRRWLNKHGPQGSSLELGCLASRA